MVDRSPDNDDGSMFPDAFIPLGQVPAAASRLERAADELRQRAGSPNAVPSLPATLAHIETALDQLAASMRLMAHAAAEWCGEDGARVEENALPPDARALLWNLRAVADTLIESRDGCPATREWARRLLDEAAANSHRPSVTPASERASALRRGQGGCARPSNGQRMPTLDKTYPDRRVTSPARAVPRCDIRPGPTLPDVRREPVGNFVDRVGPDDPVGSFGNLPRLRRQGAGAFAGDPDRQRQGSFGDHDLAHAA